MRALFFVLALLSFCAHADVAKYMATSWSDGKTIVDYTVLHDFEEVNEITLALCANPPDGNSKCVYSDMPRLPPVTTERSFVINDPGVHHGLFFKQKKRLLFGTKKKLVWEQFFYNPAVASIEIQALAEAHAPIVSFHLEERYFPVSIGTIFNRPLNHFSFSYRDISRKHQIAIDTTVDQAAEFMRYHGHSRNRIELDKGIAKTLRGSRDQFPVYWLHEQLDENRLWITYIFLYAFDEKNYSFSSIADHSVDRESVSVLLTKDNTGQWNPSEVVYAGHLSTQPTTFLGCQDAAVCSQPGSRNDRWLGGKTTVRWENVSRIGTRPVVYVAHGSHAVTPAHGFYRLNDGAGIKLLEEPAGSPQVNDYVRSYQLVQLDFSNEGHRTLSYSGRTIKGLTEWYRSFPFVRVPVAQWSLSNKNFVMDDCVANTADDCRDYIVDTGDFLITEVDFPDTIEINTVTSTSVYWTGQPEFPLAMKLANLNCSDQANCESQAGVLGGSQGFVIEEVINPIPFTVECSVEPGSVRLGIALLDQNGLQTPFYEIRFECV